MQALLLAVTPASLAGHALGTAQHPVGEHGDKRGLRAAAARREGRGLMARGRLRIYLGAAPGWARPMRCWRRADAGPVRALIA